MSEDKKSWRQVYTIHQAAEIFPRLPQDELREQGIDIKKNKLLEPIVLWSPTPEESDSAVILDGINRLDAMELVGIETLKRTGDKYRLCVPVRYLSLEKNLYFPDAGGVDPYSYVISKNIYRRHLTKEQKAGLIIKVMKSAELAALANLAKPVHPRNEKGQLQGQTNKDELKARVVEAARKHDISQRTIERSLAKDRGPVQAPRPAFERTSPQPVPRTDIPNIAIDRIARDAINYLRTGLEI